jgi:hypothetical protein
LAEEADFMGLEILLAVFIMAVGLSLAGAGTHLYQGIFKEQAMLRYDGQNVFGMFGNLAMSFLCGPYIMLQMGWRQEQQGGSIALASILIAAFVAFGWAFITGLLFVGGFLAAIG